MANRRDACKRHIELSGSGGGQDLGWVEGEENIKPQINLKSKNITLRGKIIITISLPIYINFLAGLRHMRTCNVF